MEKILADFNDTRSRFEADMRTTSSELAKITAENERVSEEISQLHGVQS